MRIITKLLTGILLVTLLAVLTSSCKKDDGVVTPDSNTNWTKTFGGSVSDVATAMLPSPGGYIVFGHTTSFGAGNDDAFAMQINDNGDAAWVKSYGGSGFDVITSAAQTIDGNFIMAGTSTSFNASQIDVFAIKIDASGNLIWAKSYKLPGMDYAVSVKQKDDGSYVIGGSSDSYGAGYSDAMWLNIDASGNLVSAKVYGGVWNDVATSMVYFNGGGFNIAGYTFSAGATCDIMLLSLSPSGDLNWAKVYGGEGIDQANDVAITDDGIGIYGFIISGYTQSFGLASGDAYFIKTDINGYHQWSKTIGGSTGMDQSLRVIQTEDGGYISTGFSNSFGTAANGIFNIRLFGDGAYKWSAVYGGASNEQGNSIFELGDNGLVIAGIKQTSANINDITVSRLKEDGTACGNYNSVSPSGGDPVTSVIETNNITALSVTTFETVNANIIVNTASFNSEVNCSNP
ncbi:MAG: hypothetical protein EHM58_19465 [Ignavibacteriae bacterium]|nr:MAG: hypothetical protein EHM58_19465 [Ignavibacteriota bacterium]